MSGLKKIVSSLADTGTEYQYDTKIYQIIKGIRVTTYRWSWPLILWTRISPFFLNLSLKNCNLCKEI